MKLHYCLVFLFLFGCQGVPNPDPHDPNKEVSHDQLRFEFTEDQLNWTFDSRDTTYEITNPIPKLEFEENAVEVKKMKVRGNSSSRVRRKSFNVDTYEKINFSNNTNLSFSGSKDFRLIAMHADFCYIENRISYGLLERAQIYPLYFRYVEVLLNQKSNGLYLFIENPNDYFLDKNDHAILLRRGYFGKIDSYKYAPNGDGFTEDEYLDAFASIYRRLKNHQGEQLYNELSEVLNVRQYMQKMAFDYLIKNGDSTDEIYLYDIPGDGKIQYNVVPWDLDDIFAELPHEIGNPYFTGNELGDRSYYSVADVVNDVGEKLIFSIEDDLDYMIAKDPYLYAIYLEELESLMSLITDNDIDFEFDKLENELTSFFDCPAITEQTNYDDNICDPEILIQQIADKKMLLINRRQEILDQL